MRSPFVFDFDVTDCTFLQLLVGSKSSIALLVRSAGCSRRLGMEARASIIPQFGQMFVALSARERAGGSVYRPPHIGQMRPACSLLLIAASFCPLRFAIGPQEAEP